MAIEYTLRVAEPHTHLVEVEVRIRPADSPIEMVMPSWTPGSYLMREFARNVQDFSARDTNGPLEVFKTDKSTWRIEGDFAGTVTVRYLVYANELTVRTSHVDASHAYINGASVFMYPAGMEREAVLLHVDAPDGWRVATSLDETDDGAFHAADYDELVDCPLEIGLHRVIAWEVDGIPHRYAAWGPGQIDEGRLVSDTNRIIRTCAEMFGGLPYNSFLFLVHVIPGGRGGLEHRSSCSLHVSPSWLGGADYEKLLALVAHEFFHIWLGKRIRPEPLGPFDYTRENYTRNLWVVEGFTTYYTDLILLRAGLMTRERYLARLGDSIARLEALPGRLHQTLEESSFDAWIRFYRPDAHTPNSQVSYYHKGSLVALALDLEIRRASGGGRSLDDVMRVLWERYGRADRGFPEERSTGIQAVIEEVYGGPVDDLLDAYVAGTVEIDFDGHLEAVGLGLEEGEARAYRSGVVDAGGVEVDETEARAGARVVAAESGRADLPGASGASGSGAADTADTASGTAVPGGRTREEAEFAGRSAGDGGEGAGSTVGSPAVVDTARAAGGRGSGGARSGGMRVPPIDTPGPCERRLGLRIREVGGELRVANVMEGTAAHDAGVNSGDVIVAADGMRASRAELESLTERLKTGSTLELTLLRRQQLVAVRVRVAGPAPRRARIVALPAADARQVGRREGWLQVLKLG